MTVLILLAVLLGVGAFWFLARYGVKPNVALLSREDYADGVDYGVTVRAEGYIRRNNVWVGWEGI